jgi:hypothetical protein
MRNDVLLLVSIGYLLMFLVSALSVASFKASKPWLFVGISLSTLWYLVVSKIILHGPMYWYANAGYEIAGGKLLEEAAVPMANVVLVIAWYSTSLLLVLFVKRIMKGKGA